MTGDSSKDRLFGREEAAEQIASVFEEVEAGDKRGVLLLGDPGVGKSRLLRWAHGRAIEQGTIAVLIRVPTTRGVPPFHPLAELLAGFRDHLAHSGQEIPEVLFQVDDTCSPSLPQLVESLETVSTFGPVSIFIDDFTWAPAESTSMLLAALRVAQMRVFLGATSRLDRHNESGPSLLPQPGADLWFDHIRLRGISLDAIHALSEAFLGGAIVPSLARILYERTLGNPLFATETLREWKRTGAAALIGGYWALATDDDLPASPSLQEMISSRLSVLTPNQLHCATSLAVLGRDTELDLLRAATDSQDDIFAETLKGLIADEIVATDDNSRYRLAHPLYASAILDSLGQPERHSAHERVYRALRGPGLHSRTQTELAHHAVRAIEQKEELAEVLAAAAHEAENSGSYPGAAEWYERVAEHAGDEAARVHAKLRQAAATTNFRPTDAIAIYSSLLQTHLGSAIRVEALIGRAVALRRVGRFEEAVEDLRNAHGSAGRITQFDIRHSLAVLEAIRGRVDVASAQFRALEVDTTGLPVHARTIGHLAHTVYCLGDLYEGHDLCEAALRECRDSEYIAYLNTNIVWYKVLKGDWTNARSLLHIAAARATRDGDSWNLACLLASNAKLTSWEGDPATALDHANRAVKLAAELDNEGALFDAKTALALAFLEGGAFRDVIETLTPHIASRELEPRENALPHLIMGEAMIELGDLRLARESLAAAREYVSQARLWEVATDRLAAQIELADSFAPGAVDVCARWLEEPSPVAFEQARLLEVAAQAIAKVGDRTSALALADEATGTYRRLGSKLRLDRVSRWRSENVRRPRGRPRSLLPGGITRRELDVLDLVVKGKTNREIAGALFLSIGTVNKHLENIMEKAKVSRRTELVAFSERMGHRQPDPEAAEPELTGVE